MVPCQLARRPRRTRDATTNSPSPTTNRTIDPLRTVELSVCAGVSASRAARSPVLLGDGSPIESSFDVSVGPSAAVRLSVALGEAAAGPVPTSNPVPGDPPAAALGAAAGTAASGPALIVTPPWAAGPPGAEAAEPPNPTDPTSSPTIPNVARVAPTGRP